MVYNADCRNKNLDPDSAAGKGYITEVLVAKFLGINTCFDITGNFNHKAFDMYEDKNWGIIDAKGSILYNRRDNCYFHYFNTEKNDIPDFFFCVGYDEDMTHVDRTYIIPNEEYINKLYGIYILRDGYSKYHIFRENEKPWDDLFHTLKLDNCPVLRNIGSKKTLEIKKIRSYKQRMREKYKRDILKMSDND